MTSLTPLAYMEHTKWDLIVFFLRTFKDLLIEIIHLVSKELMCQVYDPEFNKRWQEGQRFSKLNFSKTNKMVKKYKHSTVKDKLEENINYAGLLLLLLVMNLFLQNGKEEESLCVCVLLESSG